MTYRRSTSRCDCERRSGGGTVRRCSPPCGCAAPTCGYDKEAFGAARQAGAMRGGLHTETDRPDLAVMGSRRAGAGLDRRRRPPAPASRSPLQTRGLWLGRWGLGRTKYPQGTKRAAAACVAKESRAVADAATPVCVCGLFTGNFARTGETQS